MRLIFCLLFLINSLSAMTIETAPVRMEFDHGRRLLICSRLSPLLCPYFNMTEEEAKQEVQKTCGTFGDDAYLKAQWEEVNGVKKISGILCVFKLPSMITNGYCKSAGFDCAHKQKMCVMHGMTKPNVNLIDPGFLQAQQDIMADPTKVSSYPKFFYNCK